MNLKKILGFAVGPIGAAAFGLITIPVMAWYYSAADLGRLNLLQLTISLFVLTLVLGLDQAYVREFHRSEKKHLLLRACFLPGFTLLLGVAFTTSFFASNIAAYIYGDDDVKLYWITMICVAAAFVSRFLSLILRMQEKGLAFSMSQLIPKGLLLVLVVAIALIGLPNDFLILQSAFCLSTVTVTFVYLWNTRADWKPALAESVVFSDVKQLLAYGFPLIFSGLAYWGLTSVSAFGLRAYSSLSELGVYSVAISFAGVASIFQAIFSVVWAPQVYKWVEDGQDLSKVDLVARQALAVVCLIFALCGCFAWVIDFLLPAEYGMVKYLMLCTIIQPLLYTLSEITGIGINVARRTSLTLWVVLVALGLNVGVNILLVPTYGAAGAAIANASAFLFFFVARTEISAYVWRATPRIKIYIGAFCMVALSILAVLFGPIAGLTFFVGWPVVLLLFILFFKDELVDAFAFLRNAYKKKSI